MTEKKIRVVLVCAAGMSSSLIEEKIKHAAEAAGKQMELKAVDSTRMAFWDYDQERMDIIWSRLRRQKKSIIDKANAWNIVQDIDTIAYALRRRKNLRAGADALKERLAKIQKANNASCRNAGKKF